jgi:hypothetical protein
MVQIVVVVREPKSLAMESSLTFEVSEVPRVGDYVSIRRKVDQREPHGQDVIVRHVWWRLTHPEAEGYQSSEEPSVGELAEISVECDPAIGPYSSEQWRETWIDTDGVSTSRVESTGPRKVQPGCVDGATSRAVPSAQAALANLH